MRTNDCICTMESSKYNEQALLTLNVLVYRNIHNANWEESTFHCLRAPKAVEIGVEEDEEQLTEFLHVSCTIDTELQRLRALFYDLSDTLLTCFFCHIG